VTGFFIPLQSLGRKMAGASHRQGIVAYLPAERFSPLRGESAAALTNISERV
jgi:hypothetical protein